MVMRRGTGAKRLSLMDSVPPSTVDPDRHLACDQPGQGATDRNHCEDPTLAQVHQHEDETEDDPQRYADHNEEDHLRQVRCRGSTPPPSWSYLGHPCNKG